jgi:hypothetical protein
LGSDEMLPKENIYITEGDLLQKIIDFSLLPDKEKEQKWKLCRSIAVEKFDIEQTKFKIINVINEVNSLT